MATALRYAPLGPLFVVVRGDDDPVREPLSEIAQLTFVNSPEHQLGMGHSLAAGASALVELGWSHPVLVALADMPLVRESSLQALCSATGGDVVQPTYRGQPGHPVRFPADLLPALARLTGDEGARSVLSGNPDRLTRLSLDDPGVLADIDRPADLSSPA